MAEPGERKSVYIVDDDESVRDSLCALLSAHGFHPFAFPSAEDFLARFDPQKGLCVFIDLRMPGIGGLETIKRIRAISDALIVVLSAVTAQHEEDASLHAGADLYIVKPFRPRHLQRHVDKRLRDLDSASSENRSRP